MSTFNGIINPFLVMKYLNYIYIQKIVKSLSFLVVLLLLGCNNTAEKSEKEKKTTEEKVTKAADVLWALKVITPDGQSLEIKAIDANGKQFDVNAIQDSDQDSFLNIKAFVGDKMLPVKVLMSKNSYKPVKAIAKGGITYNIKAITPTGEKLDIKGVIRFGNIIVLKAITKKGGFYGVKALSPTGELNDVLGVKINVKDKEMSLNGFSVLAHLKAMHQSMDIPINKDIVKKSKKKTKNKSKNEIKIKWNIKAVTPSGKNLPIKAFDTLGNKYDVKAIQDSKQSSFINVKALVNRSMLPIKIIMEEGEEYSPLKAIDQNGDFYAIKAITEDGKTYPVMGVSRSGNIIHIKAVTDDGSFYAVKAFSPKGELNDVKGIKIFDRPIEMNMRGAKVYGHVKAIKQ